MFRTTQRKKASLTKGKPSQHLEDDQASSSAGANIMQLQRTLGNQATMQMLKSQSAAIQLKANVIQRDSDDEAEDDFVDDSGYDADTEASPKLTPEQKKALKRYPREVTREDAIIDKGIGEYGGGKGKAKAHRNASRDLVPAGAGLKLDGQSPITAMDHLKGTYPNKGASSRISFANRKKAQALRDYSSATKPTPSVSSLAPEEQSPKAITATLKARKLMRASMKGKTTASVETTNDLIRAVRAESGKSATKEEGYAKRDAEVESIGHIDRRFLKYSDDVDNGSSSESDSDSDTDDSSTDYSDLEDNI